MKFVVFNLLVVLLLLSSIDSKILTKYKKELKLEPKTCTSGFGFKGVSVDSLRKNVTEFLQKHAKSLIDKTHEFFQANVKNEKIKKMEAQISPYIEPVFNKVIELAGSGVKSAINMVFDGAIGDFKGSDFKKDESLKLLCGAIDYAPESTIGVLAFKIGMLPCTATAPVAIQVCFTFNQCGLLTLSFNGGLLSCLAIAANASGYGAAVTTALGVISKAAVGFSFRREIVQKFELVYYDKIKDKILVKEKENSFAFRGHFFIDIELNLTNVIFGDFPLGEMKASDIIKLGGTVKLLVSLGDTVERIEDTFSKLLNMKVQGIGAKFEESKKLGKEFLFGLAKTGAGVGIKGEVEAKINLLKLTKVIPDISIAKLIVNIVSLLPGNETGLPGGIYFFAEIGSNLFQETLGAFINKVIFPLVKMIKPSIKELKDIDLGIKFHFGLFLGEGAAGFSINALSGLLSLRCMVKYSNADLSCTIDTWGTLKAIAIKAVKAIFKNKTVQYTMDGAKNALSKIKEVLTFKKKNPTVLIQLP